MAAKKQAAKSVSSAAKAGKAKKPAVKPVPKKTAPARKPAAKAAPAAPAKAAPAAAKPAATVGKGPRPAAAAPAELRKTVTPVQPSDRNEEMDSESLLAGPRNVQPYVPKRGEQYMSKEQLEHFRTILTNWKQDLMMEVDRTVSHMKDEAANFPDPNDRATQEEEFSLELRTRDRERKLI
ncbi:MAG TPA: hypothetical protein VKO83_05385, partial [Steroidobacteraceae bacterium]|nr:hypothetical protein [Steroidobacteraceae bacterium]